MKEIRKIIKAYDEWLALGERMALATVVKIEESSYRRIGARMLVAASGNFVGGISGGCLEGNALQKAKFAIHKNETSKVIYDTLEEDAHQIGIGLGCNGRIEILFTPIEPSDPSNPIELLRKAIDANQPAIMLKIIDADQSKHLGENQLLLAQEEASIGSIEPTILSEVIAKTLNRKKPEVFQLQNSQGENLELLVEFLRPETRLVIVGNNYDVHAFIGFATELGWQVSVVGKKEKILKSIHQSVSRIFDYSELEQIPIDEYTAVVLMTHDYDWDLKILPHFLDKKMKYLGILGPRKRFDKLNEELQNKKGISDLSDLMSLYTPVGLDIGAESPEEIALAIAAEIVSTFRGREGKSLKFRAGTIHERD